MFVMETTFSHTLLYIHTEQYHNCSSNLDIECAYDDEHLAELFNKTEGAADLTYNVGLTAAPCHSPKASSR